MLSNRGHEDPRRWITSLAGGLLVASLAGTALADGGSFEAAASFTTNYSKLEFAGQSITGGSIHGSATIIKSTGGLFPEGSSAVLDCIVYAKKSDVGLDLEAPCANTDQSGDKIFYIGTRRAGDMKAGGEGQQELLGGTGKYSGLTGRCSFKTDYLQANLAVTRQKCQWQKP